MRHPPLQFPLLWAIYILFWILGIFCFIWPLPALTAAFLILLACRQLWKIPRLALCLILFTVALAWFHARVNYFEEISAHMPAWTQGKRIPRIAATVVATQALPENKLRLLLANVGPAADNSVQTISGDNTLPGLCMWTWADPTRSPLPGQRVEITRPIKQIHSLANAPGQSHDWQKLANEIYWRMWSRGDKGDPHFFGKPGIFSKIRHSLREKFVAALENPRGLAPRNGENSNITQGKAVLLALIFGERSAISQNTRENFAAATLAHSLALSGQHLCVAAFLGLLAIACLARLRPTAYLTRPKIILIACASIPFAVMYLWLGDAPASLLRASCMLFILAWWLWRGSVFNLIDLLCAALGIILIFRPFAILEPGLQLSVLCIAVIAISLPALSRLFPHAGQDKNYARAILQRALQILAISLLIQLALLPINLLRFQIAGFCFPLNLLWLPVLSLIVLPLAAFGLLLAALCPLLGLAPARFMLNMASLPCDFLIHNLSGMRDLGLLSEPAFLLPHWTVLLAFATLACSLAWLAGSPPGTVKKTFRPQMFLVCIVLFAIAPAQRIAAVLDGKVELSAIDVGQGQAIAMSLPGGMRLLLDAGGFGNSTFDTGKNIVGPVLASNSPPYLTAALNSHPDMDHLGGIFYILDNFRVDNLFHNGYASARDKNDKWQAAQAKHSAIALRAGDKITLGKSRLYLEVLNPDGDRASSSFNKKGSPGNAASLVLRLCKDGRGLALFTGDAEKSTLKKLLTAGFDLRAQILFLPHHGSDKSYLPAFYKAVNPNLVIANCGFQNRWNYPGEKIIRYFADRKVPLLDTGNKGRIDIIPTANSSPVFNTARAN